MSLSFSAVSDFFVDAHAWRLVAGALLGIQGRIDDVAHCECHFEVLLESDGLICLLQIDVVVLFSRFGLFFDVHSWRRVAGALLEFQERIDDVAGHCGCHVEVLLQRYNVVCASECVWHRVQQRCGFACCVGAVICCCTNTQCHSAKILVANVKLRRTTSPLDRSVSDQNKPCVLVTLRKSKVCDLFVLDGWNHWMLPHRVFRRSLND